MRQAAPKIWSTESSRTVRRSSSIRPTERFRGRPKGCFLGSSEKMHLVERFTRVALDTIKYEVTVSDPTTWTKPWSAEIRLKQTQERLYEAACHEGNFAIITDILSGAQTSRK